MFTRNIYHYFGLFSEQNDLPVEAYKYLIIWLKMCINGVSLNAIVLRQSNNNCHT